MYKCKIIISILFDFFILPRIFKIMEYLAISNSINAYWEEILEMSCEE